MFYGDEIFVEIIEDAGGSVENSHSVEGFVSEEIRGSSFVDGGAGIGDELHLQSLGKAGGAAEISQFELNQSVQGSVGEFQYLFVFCPNQWFNL